MTKQWRLLPTIFVAICVLAMLMHGVILQYEDYHRFANTRRYFAIPNTMDVLSNMGFGLTGLLGLFATYALFRKSNRPVQHASQNSVSLVMRTHRWQVKDVAYLIFLLSILTTCFGSAYYHWAPDDGRLFWDRLPIALACASLMAAVRIEALQTLETQQIRPPIFAIAHVFFMLLFALFSVLWWQYTGDLRPYLGLQLLAILLIPMWQHLYPTARRTRWVFLCAVCLYVCAKATEILDAEILHLTGFISGHTMKHLLASAAAGLICWNWLRTKS